MSEYDGLRGFNAELRDYVRTEWNGDGGAVLGMIARAGRENPVVQRPTFAQRALRKVAGIASAIEATLAHPSES